MIMMKRKIRITGVTRMNGVTGMTGMTGMTRSTRAELLKAWLALTIG